MFQDPNFFIVKSNNRFFIESFSGEENTDDEIDSSSDKKRDLEPPRTKFDRNELSVDETSSKVDVLVITAADGELEALWQCRDDPNEPENCWKSRLDSYNYTYWEHTFTSEDGKPFTIAAAPTLSGMGERATTGVAYRLAMQLKPRCLAMVGICAGRRGEVDLGDVIVADRVFNFQYGKIKAFYDGQCRKEEVYHDIQTYNLDPIWLDRVTNAEHTLPDWTYTIGLERPKSYAYQKRWLLHKLYDHKLNSQNCPHPQSLPEEKKTECAQWSTVIQWLLEEELLKQKNTELILTKKGEAQVKSDLLLETRIEEPAKSRVHVAPIGSGTNVQQDDRLFEYVERLQRKTLGIEMEGNAIGAAQWELQIPKMIVVKAVSDYGDLNKKKDSHFRDYATKASASFLIAFLKKYLFI